MFKNLMKAAIGVVKLPVDVVADVVTMGGVLQDRDEPHTAEGAKSIIENLKRAADPNED